MNIRICGGAFFAMFVIFVMDGNFTNGMLELYVPPGGSTDKDDLNAGRITAAENTFAILQINKRVYRVNIHGKRKREELLESGQISSAKALTDTLDDEVNHTEKTIHMWNDDEKDWKAVRLIALLTTKLMAYANALQYSFFRRAIDPADNTGLKQKAIHSLFYIDYANDINAGKTTDVIKKLLNGTRPYHGYSELVDDTFTQIRIKMEELETAINENRAILESRKKGEEPSQADTFENTIAPLTFLMNEFANMWYQYNSRVWAEPRPEDDLFKKDLDRSYEEMFKSGLDNGAERIQNNRDPFYVYHLLEFTEYHLANEFQIYEEFPEKKLDAISKTYREFKTEIRSVSVGGVTQTKIVLTQKPSTVSSSTAVFI